MSAAAILGACSRGPRPAREVFAWGAQGTRDGEFLRPRAIGVRAGRVYVIDTTGRVQVFSREGAFQFQWRLPDHANGTPTCLSFAADGRVLIADTHNSRIAEFTVDGAPLKTWGSYGTASGQFIYPTGIVEAQGGHFYISEYGVGAERVQVFDAAGKFLWQWGAHGEAPGQFNRAMAIAMDAERRVYVADTTNHRLQCFDEHGALLRVIGSAGMLRGRLKFPQGLALAPGGSLVACEYGANRISRFAFDGTYLGSFGEAGRAPGAFHSPRGVAVSEAGEVFVADTENHRIQRFPLEAIA